MKSLNFSKTSLNWIKKRFPIHAQKQSEHSKESLWD
jgi:hypothetical protein